MNSPTSSSDNASSDDDASFTDGLVTSALLRQKALQMGNQRLQSGLRELVETYNCYDCKDMGFVTRDVPLGHPDFGRAIPCHCQRETILERKVRRLHRLSNLTGLESHTFGNFIPEPAHLLPDQVYSLSRAYQACLYYAQDPTGWLLLTGGFGCGKTHLAAAIANAQLEEGLTVLFQVVPDLLDHLRATFGPQSDVSYDELFEQIRSTPLLILDDLGAHSSSPWAQEKLYQLLNYRYNAQLPTVITTNQRLDDLEPRIRSRLLDIQLVNHVMISSPDFRAGSNPEQGDLSTLNLHKEQKFENFNLNRSDLNAQERTGLKKIVQVAKDFADEPEGWLVLTGDYGCGKTHLAAAIANHQFARSLGSATFVVVPDLLDHLRATFSPMSNTPYDRRFDEIRKAPLLILDDLGTESATPWAKEKLFQILNYRYNAKLPSVITIAEREFDTLERRLLTRIMDVEHCQVCQISAPSYRGSQSQQKSQRKKTASL